jgi:hypothetical protein
MSDTQFERTVELELGGSSGQLGSAPKTIENEEEVATFHKLGKLVAQSHVTCLQQGTLGGRFATLFALECRFEGGTAGIGRFSQANIKISLSKVSSDDNANSMPPNIGRFCPVKLSGTGIPVVVTRTSGLNASISPGTSSIQAHLNANTGLKETFTRTHNLSFVGNKLACRTSRTGNNRVNWTITENSRQEEGIPNAFRVALIVTHDCEPIQATVKLSVKTKWGTLFGRPWSKPSPLILEPVRSYGPKVTSSTFDDLTEENWKQVIDFDGKLTVSKTHQNYSPGLTLCSVMV